MKEDHSVYYFFYCYSFIILIIIKENMVIEAYIKLLS